MQAVEGSATIAYVSELVEWSGGVLVKYYAADRQRVAMRNSNGSGTDGVVYLLGDHLGSTTLSVDPVLG